MRARAIASILVVLAALGFAHHADATTSCVFDAGVVRVTTAASDDRAVIEMGPAGEIEVGAAENPPPCGTATRSNTTSIVVDDLGGQDNNDVSVFAPLLRADGSEIPVFVNDTAGDDLTHNFAMGFNGPEADSVVLGDLGGGPGSGADAGIDVNGDGDVDVFFSDATHWVIIHVNTSFGDDVVTASPGSTTPWTGNMPVGVQLGGGSGEDTITGTSFGQDSLHGGEGNDVLNAGAGSEFDNIAGDEGNDLMNGSPGPDFFFDTVGGDDVMRGFAGDDEFNLSQFPIGPQGADVADGGDGVDTAIYEGRAADLSLSLDGVDNDGEANEHDNLVDVEDVWAGDGNDEVIGNNANNNIVAMAGNDTIYSGPGDDVIEPGDGDDVVDAAAGNDILGVATATAEQGNDSLYGGKGNDTVRGGAGNDTVDGGPHDDTVDGGIGDDTVRDDHGNDVLTGGIGVDRLTSGEGNDSLVLVDETADLLSDCGTGTDTAYVDPRAHGRGRASIDRTTHCENVVIQ